MANLRDYRKFIARGYSVWELAINFIRLIVVSRLVTGIKYSFAARGDKVVIDMTVNVQAAKFISIGDSTWVQRNSHLSVPLIEMDALPTGVTLSIGKRVQIGQNNLIAAAHSVIIEDNVLFGPNVYVADHTHQYAKPDVPIRDQGLMGYGSIHIETGAWIGINCVIIATNGKLITLGRNCIIAANSVVTSSVPPLTMVAGSPAKIIKQFNQVTNEWMKT